MLNLFIGVIIDNFNHLKQQVRKLKTIHGSIELVNDVLEIYRLLLQSPEGASNDDRLLTRSSHATGFHPQSQKSESNCN